MVCVCVLTIFCKASDLFVMALAVAAAVPDKSETSHFNFSFSVVVSSTFRCITELSALASWSDASAADSDSRVVDNRLCKSLSHVN